MMTDKQQQEYIFYYASWYKGLSDKERKEEDTKQRLIMIQILNEIEKSLNTLKEYSIKIKDWRNKNDSKN